MKNAELIKAVAEKSGMTQGDVKMVLESVKDVALDAVKGGQEVSIANIVTLKSIQVAEKKGESFGKPWVSPAHKAIKASVAPKYKKVG